MPKLNHNYSTTKPSRCQSVKMRRDETRLCRQLNVVEKEIEESETTKQPRHNRHCWREILSSQHHSRHSYFHYFNPHSFQL